LSIKAICYTPGYKTFEGSQCQPDYTSLLKYKNCANIGYKTAFGQLGGYFIDLNHKGNSRLQCFLLNVYTTVPSLDGFEFKMDIAANFFTDDAGARLKII
jgi:hypothetical protein